MNKRAWKTYALWVLIPEAVGALAAFLTREGTRMFRQTAVQPTLAPPGWVFPVVWGILYALMGIGAARVALAPDSRERSEALNVFFIQLGVNFLWSIIFFNFQAYGFALAWILLLLGLVIWMSVAFYRVDPLAGYLQIPYILWVSFASVLTFAVWQLNR